MSAYVVPTIHIHAMLTAGLQLRTPHSPDPLYWFWPAIDAFPGRGSWTSPEVLRQADERERLLTTKTASRVGAMLLSENRRSVAHRLDEREWEEPYLFAALPGRPDPVVVLKAIACYRYQSCEHPGWPTSEALAFCDALRDRTISCLPGYATAPWVIDHPQVFGPDVQP